MPQAKFPLSWKGNNWLLNNWVCFSKLTDSFVCFEGLPVPLKVWWQNGTLWKELHEHSNIFHSLPAELNNSLLKFLEFILQSSVHFQLQNNMSKKYMWLYVLHHVRKRVCASFRVNHCFQDCREFHSIKLHLHKIISELRTLLSV